MYNFKQEPLPLRVRAWYGYLCVRHFSWAERLFVAGNVCSQASAHVLERRVHHFAHS